jgi:hypothetical protein
MSKRDNIVKWSIVSVFVALYAMVSIISTIHVIDFFRLSNPEWLAITLAIAFEVGAAACLGAIVILDRTSRWLVWSLFILITGMQMMGNMYYAYSHLEDFKMWAELFAINEEEPIFQKRILSLVSGAILPVVALGFIKSLVDYIRPSNSNEEPNEPTPEDRLKTESDRVWEKVKELREEGKLPPEPTEEELADEPTALAFTPYEKEEEEEEEENEDVWDVTLQDGLEEEMDQTIRDLTPEVKEEEDNKAKEVEKKIATVIAKNPELKEKLNEEIKKLDKKEDKYTKPEDSPISTINKERRTFGGM